MRLSQLILSSAAASTVLAAELLYRNTFSNSSSIASWIPEGPVVANTTNNTLTLRGAGNMDDYFVYWLPEIFPDRIRISWNFQPVE